MGLKTDLKLTPSQYSWAGSLIYFGFLFWEIPCHALLQRVPSISRYSAATVIIWGTIVCCHAACKNFAGLAVCRLLLGESRIFIDFAERHEGRESVEQDP